MTKIDFNLGDVAMIGAISLAAWIRMPRAGYLRPVEVVDLIVVAGVIVVSIVRTLETRLNRPAICPYISPAMLEPLDWGKLEPF